MPAADVNGQHISYSDSGGNGPVHPRLSDGPHDVLRSDQLPGQVTALVVIDSQAGIDDA